MDDLLDKIGNINNLFKIKSKSLLIVAAIVVVGFIILIASLFSGQQQQVPATAVVSEPVKETLGVVPPPLPLIPLTRQSTPSATQIFIDPATVKLPETARVYRFNETSTLSFSKMDTIAVKLGFTGRPKNYVNGSLLWEEGQNYLIYDIKNDGFSFYLEPSLASTFSQSFRSTSKAQTITNLLTSVDLNFPDLAISDNTPTVTLEGQNLFLVPRVVNEIPVSSLPNDVALIYFNFDTNNNITSGSYYYQMLQSGDSAFGVYSLKPIREALGLLQSGQGTLMSLGINDYHVVDIKGVTAASFTGVSLVYYENKTPAQYLRPYYSFTGTVTLADGRTTDATYYIDALK